MYGIIQVLILLPLSSLATIPNDNICKTGFKEERFQSFYRFMNNVKFWFFVKPLYERELCGLALLQTQKLYTFCFQIKEPHKLLSLVIFMHSVFYCLSGNLNCQDR